MQAQETENIYTKDSLSACLQHWQDADYERCDFNKFSEDYYTDDSIAAKIYHLLSTSITPQQTEEFTKRYLKSVADSIRTRAEILFNENPIKPLLFYTDSIETDVGKKFKKDFSRRKERKLLTRQLLLVSGYVKGHEEITDLLERLHSETNDSLGINPFIFPLAKLREEPYHTETVNMLSSKTPIADDLWKELFIRVHALLYINTEQSMFAVSKLFDIEEESNGIPFTHAVLYLIMNSIENKEWEEVFKNGKVIDNLDSEEEKQEYFINFAREFLKKTGVI